jgi:hypothetical protein
LSEIQNIKKTILSPEISHLENEGRTKREKNLEMPTSVNRVDGLSSFAVPLAVIELVP